MKTLESMQKDLKEFLEFDAAVIIAVYAEEYEWGEEDYEADKEHASYLLEQVERRMKSLGRHLSSTKGKKEVETETSPADSEPQSDSSEAQPS